MLLMEFTHYLLGYVGTVLCSVGLSLTLCSVYVFTRRQMRSAVATYLAALSLSDSCLLSLGLIIAINASIPPDQQSEFFYSSRLHKHIFPYVYPCIIWFQFTSVWITIAFAIDRWFAIKWPILHYTYSSKRVCYIVLIIYASGFLYSLPRFFEYKTEYRLEKLTYGGNQTEYFEHIVITNKLLQHRIYQYIVHLVLYSLFQSILPLLLLSYFNVELIRSVQASSHFIKGFTSMTETNNRSNTVEKNTLRAREGSITRSVICLIVLFTFCQVPASILHFIYMFYRNHPILYISYDISNFLILLNSAVNFFIFAFYNRKFRRELQRICCRRNENARLISLSSIRPSLLRANIAPRRTPSNTTSRQQFNTSTTIQSPDHQIRTKSQQCETIGNDNSSTTVSTLYRSGSERICRITSVKRNRSSRSLQQNRRESRPIYVKNFTGRNHERSLFLLHSMLKSSSNSACSMSPTNSQENTETSNKKLSTAID